MNYQEIVRFFDAQLSTESTQQQVYLSYIMHNINYAVAVTTDLG